MNRWLIIGGVVVVVLIGLNWWQSRNTEQPQASQLPAPTQNVTEGNVATPVPTQASNVDPRNTTYMIEGQSVVLVNGTAQTEEMTTKVFSVTNGELTGDTVQDTAVMLQQDRGGSGIFYYQAAALNQEGKYLGTNGIFLGDRIAPQSTQITNKTIVTNYADRKPGEPMTTQPSVAMTKYFAVQGTTLVETSKP